jgi:hypothetical protein
LAFIFGDERSCRGPQRKWVSNVGSLIELLPPNESENHANFDIALRDLAKLKANWLNVKHKFQTQIVFRCTFSMLIREPVAIAQFQEGKIAAPTLGLSMIYGAEGRCASACRHRAKESAVKGVGLRLPFSLLHFQTRALVMQKVWSGKAFRIVSKSARNRFN